MSPGNLFVVQEFWAPSEAGCPDLISLGLLENICLNIVFQVEYSSESSLHLQVCVGYSHSSSGTT
jgi:hypothetical protein